MNSLPQENAPAHVARYEELRRYAVQRQILTALLGLAVVLQQGLAAWIEQSSKIPAARPAPSAERSRPAPLPEVTSTEVINVLAAMALGHMPEVHA